MTYAFSIRCGLALSALLALAACAEGLGQPATGAVSKPRPRRNPFKDVDFFINPSYVDNLRATAKRHPELADRIRKVERYPTGVWLDSIAALGKLRGWLDEAKAQQDRNGKPTLTVLVVYDLPNRDCSSAASAGELKVASGGEARYRREFIDPIATELKKHPNQPIVVVLEPDSLGNLATNMAVPMCKEASDAYKSGIVYAIKQLNLPNVSVYLDAAHAGWLGWDDNRAKIARIFKGVLAEAGGPNMIRGFALNTSNYTHLYNRDGAALEPTNPCPNELIYAHTLAQTLRMFGFRQHGLLIDTGRNGKGGIRSKWGSFCNVHGAGLGERPRVQPEPDIDAYFWVKPPGESDGVSDPSQPRYDSMCGNPDARKGAPQAGEWFEDYFLDLVRNAIPPL